MRTFLLEVDTGDVNDLTLTQILPPWLAFDEIYSGAGPQAVPTYGDTGSIDFTWSVPPVFPIDFTYTASAFLDLDTARDIVGQCTYRTDGSLIAGDTVTTHIDKITLAPDAHGALYLNARQNGAQPWYWQGGAGYGGSPLFLSDNLSAQFLEGATTGYAFLNWTGALSGAVVPQTLTVDGDIDVGAVFAVTKPVIITVLGQSNDTGPIGFFAVTRADGGPTVTSSSPTVEFPDDPYVIETPEGIEVDVTATPNSGWGFYQWSGEQATTTNNRDNPIHLDGTSNRQLTARFMPYYHSADYTHRDPNVIDLAELLRFIQLYNSSGYHCTDGVTESDDGYAPDYDVMAQDCVPHSGDYWDGYPDWKINLDELLRVIQFYNFVSLSVSSGSYHICTDESPPTEDGYCPGVAE